MQPIAIIGASCRFPGANGLAEFCQLLREGRNAVSTVPKDRWDPDALYDANPDAPGKVNTRYGGFIRNQGVRLRFLWHNAPRSREHGSATETFAGRGLRSFRGCGIADGSARRFEDRSLYRNRTG